MESSKNSTEFKFSPRNITTLLNLYILKPKALKYFKKATTSCYAHRD